MKIHVIIILFALVASCKNEMTGISEPDNLIPRDSMVILLKDFSLLESHLQLKYIHSPSFHPLMKKSGDALLKKYKISPQRFEMSFDYFATRQQEMKSIYGEILDSLNQEALLVNTTAGKK